jgi:hypothetical protein
MQSTAEPIDGRGAKNFNFNTTLRSHASQIINRRFVVSALLDLQKASR